MRSFHNQMPPAPTEALSTPAVDNLMYGAALTAGSLTTLLGIAAGSMLFYGLMIRAQPESGRQENEARRRNTSAARYVKRQKLLVMRASAK